MLYWYVVDHHCLGYPLWHVNTLKPRPNRRHFADDIFKCIFLNQNVWIPIKVSMKFVPKGPINNIPALVQIMAWRPPGDKPLSEPMMVSLTTHICVTWPQWVNSILHSRFEYTLDQLMACCLMAPRHYLNQCYLIVNMISCSGTPLDTIYGNKDINNNKY